LLINKLMYQRILIYILATIAGFVAGIISATIIALYSYGYR
jgi:hypothetical protein